jgi:hypothetical protein
MKNFKNLLIIVTTFTLVFSACKYEEGPGISFRQKRQRLANAWMCTNYQVDGAVNDSILNSFTYGDSLQIIFAIYQNGGYAVNLQYTKEYAASTSWHKYYIANNSAAIGGFYDYIKNTLFKRLGSGGKWTFYDKHRYVHFGRNDLSYSAGEDKPFKTKIIMLRDDMLKLSYTGLDGKLHLATFEPRNE